MATNSAEANKKAKDEALCQVHGPFEILNKYRSQMKRFRNGEPREKINLDQIGTEKWNVLSTDSCQVLSSARILRMARMKQIQSNSTESGDFLSSDDEPGLSRENDKYMNLSLCLLDAADKFSHQRYDQAEKLLDRVLTASCIDHPVKRILTYFAQDLRDRVDSKIFRIGLDRRIVHVDVDEAYANLKAAAHTVEQKLPLCQITHFTGIQTILDSVASFRRIHFIDIGRKLWTYWIVIVHDLANRKKLPVEHLKITAVCTLKDDVDGRTRRLLSSFAESMNLPFKLNILHSEIHKLKKDEFELEAGEKVAIYMELCLMSLAASPEKVEALIRAVKSISPYLLVVSDLEASSGASMFIDRFCDAMFNCSALFDCLESCLERDNRCRKIIEQVYLQEIARNCVMSQNDGSFKQCLKIVFWREYFARFGIIETELSQPSLYQASLLIRESASWKDCTLSMSGKCMLIGWNGIPLRSVSAWKLRREKKTYM